MAAFFDFPNEKIFSFPIEDFRQTAWMSGAAPDRGMLDAWQAEGNNADRRAVLPKKRRCPNRFVCGYGKRRTTQKAKSAPRKGQPCFEEIKRKESVSCHSFPGFMLLLRPAAFFDSLMPPVLLHRKHRGHCCYRIDRQRLISAAAGWRRPPTGRHGGSFRRGDAAPWPQPPGTPRSAHGAPRR